MPQHFGDLEEFAEKVFTRTRGNYRVCSLHFARSAYEIRGLTTFLRRDAIPTLFPEPVTLQLPAMRLSRAFLNSQLHIIHARPTTNTQQPVRQMVVGLSQHEPPAAPNICIKTEDEDFETSDLNCQASLSVSPQTYDAIEGETPSREILNELHIEQTMAPCIKTEEEYTSGLLTSELHTTCTLPPNNGLQEVVARFGEQEPAMPSQIKQLTGFIPIVSRKRPCTPKNIGTMTEHFPEKVHKSIQFDKSMGTNHKGFQVSLRPVNSSIGIQCNLVDLPSLRMLSPCLLRSNQELDDTSRALHMDLR